MPKAPAIKREPPSQPCAYCGKTIYLTPISLMRFHEAGGPKAYRLRGFFYSCPCSPYDLQPNKAEVWDEWEARG